MSLTFPEPTTKTNNPVYDVSADYLNVMVANIPRYDLILDNTGGSGSNVVTTLQGAIDASVALWDASRALTVWCQPSSVSYGDGVIDDRVNIMFHAPGPVQAELSEEFGALSQAVYFDRLALGAAPTTDKMVVGIENIKLDGFDIRSNNSVIQAHNVIAADISDDWTSGLRPVLQMHMVECQILAMDMPATLVTESTLFGNFGPMRFRELEDSVLRVNALGTCADMVDRGAYEAWLSIAQALLNVEVFVHWSGTGQFESSKPVALVLIEAATTDVSSTLFVHGFMKQTGSDPAYFIVNESVNQLFRARVAGINSCSAKRGSLGLFEDSSFDTTPHGLDYSGVTGVNNWADGALLP